MNEAVTRAFQSRKQATSCCWPGLPSFDMFASYEERGKVFKEEVPRLKSKVQSHSS